MFKDFIVMFLLSMSIAHNDSLYVLYCVYGEE